MPRILCIMLLGMFSLTDSFSQPAAQASLTSFQDQEISFGQLPEDVQSAFEDSLWGQWEIKKIIRINQDTNHITYKMTVSNGLEELELYLDQQGNIIG